MITPLKKYGEKPAKKPESNYAQGGICNAWLNDQCSQACQNGRGGCAHQTADKDIKVVYLCFNDDDYAPEVFDNEEAARWYVVENAYGYDDDMICDDVDELQSRLYEFFDEKDWDTYNFHVWYESREVRS